MNELHLFAGTGGGILGGMLLGHTCVCAVEIEPYCRKVLLQRQRDGMLPKFPIWDDVRTFNGKPWRGKVDIICGGFGGEKMADAEVPRQPSGLNRQAQVQFGRSCTWWDRDPADQDGAFESQLGRVADGVANRVDRLKAIGNGQVPLVAATAFKLLKGDGDER